MDVLKINMAPGGGFALSLRFPIDKRTTKIRQPR